MRTLKFAAGLAVATLIHFAGATWFAGFSQHVDLFLVVALFNALGGSLLGGMFGGLAAGLVTDTIGGGLYGLFGFADTIVGYGAAFAARRLVIQRATAIWLLFSVAAAGQQAVVLGLAQLLQQDPTLPSFLSVAIKVVTTGLIGAIGYLLGQRSVRTLRLWKRSRSARLR